MEGLETTEELVAVKGTAALMKAKGYTDFVCKEFEKLGVKLSDDPNEVIVLRAVYGKTAGGLVAIPTKDERTGNRKGIPVLSDNQKNDFPFKLDPEFKIKDNTKFKLNDPFEAYTWNWVKESKYIAKSIQEADKNPDTLYYIEDYDGNINENLKKFEYKAEAFTALSKLTLAEKQNVVRLLKINPLDYKENELFELVMKEADTNPRKIIDAIAVLSSNNGKILIIINKLLEKQIITRYSDSGYKYANEIIGLNQEEAILFFKNRDNASLVKLLKDKVGEIDKQLEPTE